MLVQNARILTLAGPREPRRRDRLRDLGVIARGWMKAEGGRVTHVEAGDPPSDLAAAEPQDEVVDAGGRVLMPGFVDCHTHACWAGDRYDEFARKIAGATYLDILNAGGGIMSTVRAVREASEEELTGNLLRQVARMAALGTTTIEVKSGYGLTPQDELKMLRAIRAANDRTPLTLRPTFLGAHAIDRGQNDFVDRTIAETLPAATREFPGIACDAYCEKGAWSLDETRRLFEAAQAYGCPLRVHADQFNPLGATRLAIDMGAMSVDHLEATTDEDLELLARSDTLGVMLPASGFHLGEGYAAGRRFVDLGGAPALATNDNPGSAPTPSMPFVIALACRPLRLSVEEAIVAATFNAACVLGLQDEVGSIEPGKRADVQLLDTRDERDLGFTLAGPGPLATFVAGEIVHRREDRSRSLAR